MNKEEVDSWLATQGLSDRITARQAVAYAHAYGNMFGRGEIRPPFRFRHAKVTMPRMVLATYLAGRTSRSVTR